MGGVLDVRLGMYGCMDAHVRTTRLISKLSDGWIISRVVMYKVGTYEQIVFSFFP
jgi:hypothetical protein